VMRDEHASLAKGVCTIRMRETVGWAPANFSAPTAFCSTGTSAAFVADAEAALYSYEGTRRDERLDRRQGDHRIQRLRLTHLRRLSS